MISFGTAPRITTEFSSRDFVIRLATLTPAEREVAQHLSRGLLNKEIADVLGKSEPTVKQQVRSILAKMGLPNRGRLIAWLCTGVTSPDL